MRRISNSTNILYCQMKRVWYVIILPRICCSKRFNNCFNNTLLQCFWNEDNSCQTKSLIVGIVSHLWDKRYRKISFFELLFEIFKQLQLPFLIGHGASIAKT